MRVAKVMSMPGTRPAVADLCMFGLAVCDEGGPGFVNASVRTVTNTRCEVNAQARIDSLRVGGEQHKRETGTNRNMGTSSCPSNGGTVERGSAGVEDAGTEEEGKGCKEDMWDCSWKRQYKGTSHVQEEMRKLMHHDEQELLNLWEGWQDNEGGWLDLELCVQARREEVEYIRRHTLYTRVPRETCLRGAGKAPIETGWRPTRDSQGSPTCARGGVAKENKTHARPESYASTPPPLEALQVVLSEVATGKR